MERAGDAHTEPPGPGWRFERLSIPRLDVSSSDVRARLAAGRPVDGLVPPAVVREIRARGLYTPAECPWRPARTCRRPGPPLDEDRPGRGSAGVGGRPPRGRRAGQ